MSGFLGLLGERSTNTDMGSDIGFNQTDHLVTNDAVNFLVAKTQYNNEQVF